MRGALLDHTGRMRRAYAKPALLLSSLLLLGIIASAGVRAAPAYGGLSVSTSGLVTGLFLAPISYQSSGYYYDSNNNLQYASYGFHHGIDVSGGCVAGQYPVYASADGTVALAQYIGDGYGSQVVIDHGYNVGGNGKYTYTFYSHMGSRSTGLISIVVSPGQIVRAGQLLGYQGNDGSSYGSCAPNPGTHLDWEVRLSSTRLTYNTYMRYSGTAASPNFYHSMQLTYGDSSPMSRLTAGSVGGGAVPTTPPLGTPTPGPCGMRFSDLPDTHWAYTHVAYLYCKGIVTGYPDGTFRPDEYNNRGQFTKMIVLGHGWNLYNPYFPTFTDVAPDNTFYQPIETSVLRGVINGYSDHTFKPGNPVTRAQAAKMLVIAHGWSPLLRSTPTFRDVPSSHWAFGYIERSAERGILSGYGDGTFRPDPVVTRAQLAKMLSLTMQQTLLVQK